MFLPEVWPTSAATLHQFSVFTSSLPKIFVAVPSLSSHSRIVRSSAAVARSFPSGEKRTQLTGLPSSREVSRRGTFSCSSAESRAFIFHIFILLSTIHEEQNRLGEEILHTTTTCGEAASIWMNVYGKDGVLTVGHPLWLLDDHAWRAGKMLFQESSTCGFVPCCLSAVLYLPLA